MWKALAANGVNSSQTLLATNTASCIAPAARSSEHQAHQHCAELNAQDAGTGTGFTSQISLAYCAMHLSEEKKPEEAVYRMERRVHSSWSLYRASISSCSSPSQKTVILSNSAVCLRAADTYQVPLQDLHSSVALCWWLRSREGEGPLH